MTLHVKQGGLSKQVNDLYVKQGGVQKRVQEGWVKENGVVKRFYLLGGSGGIRMQPAGVQRYLYSFPSYGDTFSVVDYDDGNGPFTFSWYFGPGQGTYSISTPDQASTHVIVYPYFSRTLFCEVTDSQAQPVTRTVSAVIVVSAEANP